MKKLIAFLVLQICMIAWMINPLAAKAEEKVIRVGFPQIQGTSETCVDGSYSGYTYEYLKKISQITGWEYEFITPEGNENEQLLALLEMLKKGEIDILGSVLKMEELVDIYDFPENSYGTTFTTLSITETNTDINEVNVSISEHLKVGVRRGAAKRIEELKRYCAINNIELTIIECDSKEELLVTLFAEEVDAILGVDLTPYEGTRVVAKFSGKSYYFAAAKGNQELIEELDQALATIMETDPNYQMSLYNKCINNRKTRLVLTKEEKEYISSIGTLKVLVPSESAPFQYQTETGYAGISIECLNEIAMDIGIKIQYIMRDPNMELSDCIDQNNIDIVLGIPYLSEFAADYDLYMSQPYAETETTIFSRRHLDLTHTDDNILALPLGAEIIPDISSDVILYYSTIEECIQAIQNGEADYGYGNSHSVSYYMTKNVYSNLVTAQLSNLKKEFCFGFTMPLDTRLASIINRGIGSFDISQLQGFLIHEIFKLGHESTLKEYIALHPEKFIFVIIIISGIIIITYFYFIKLKQKEQLLVVQNKSKERFLSDMSHEMRTPLSAIIGLDEILLKEMKEQDKNRECALKIRDSSNHLLNLINDILDLSKIGQNKLFINEKSFDFNKTLKDIDVIYQITARDKNLLFKTDFPTELDYMLIGDELRLKQVIINLISNAIKYNKKNGTIFFTSEILEESAADVLLNFTIKDTGFGIKKKNQKKIFEAFEREGRVEGESGAGLGLSISKNISELMGGSLTFESQEGVGSTFHFKVKLKKGEPKENWYCKEEKETIPDLNGYPILLVEDNEINAMICEKLLTACGATVDIAHNGEIACEKFADSVLYYYKVVLMDIRMPVMNGLEACEHIRNMQRQDANSVIIIALSANAYEADREMSKAAGMNAHLAKPIKEKELYQTLENYLMK